MNAKQFRIGRRTFLQISAASVLTSLAACTPAVSPAAPGAGDAPAADEAITLKMVSWHFDENLLRLFEEEFVPAFQQEHPNVSFEFIATDNARINDQLLSAFAAGDGPDLWEHGSAASGAGWAASGQAAELDTYWESYERKDDYLPNAVETAYLNGKLYSIPRQMSPASLYYRKDFFEEAGIDVGDGPETWDEYLELAKALTITENGTITRAGAWVPTTSWDGIQMGWWHFLYQNGATILNEDLTATNFDSEAGIEAIQWYHDLLWVHQVDVLGGIGSGLTGHPVNIGTAAMGFAPIQTLVQARNNFPDVLPNVGVLKPTGKVREANLLAIDRIFLSKDGHVPDAWNWLEFIHRPENMEARYQVDGSLPPTYSFMESETVAQDPLLRDFLSMAEYGYQWPPSPKWNEFRSFMTSMSEAALTSPDSVAGPVQQFAQEINTVLAS